MAGSRERKLTIVAAGEDRGASKVLDDTGTKADGLGSKFAGMGKLAAAGFAAVGVGAIAAVGALVQIGGSFDDVYDKIATTTGAAGAELDGLKQDFRDVVASVPASFEDAGSAVASLAQKLDLTGEPLSTLSSQFLELSRITDTDLTTNMDAGVQALQNFGVAAEDQGAAMDWLFRASQESGIAFGDLAGQLASNGPVLRSLGYDFESGASFLAAFGKAGIDVSEVMPAMAKSLSNAAKEGKDAGAFLDEAWEGIAGAPDITAAAGIAMEAFGAKAGPKLAEMIRSGQLALGDMYMAISEGDGTILEAGKSTQDFGEKWTLFKNRVLLVLEPIAMRVFDGLGTAMDKLGPIMDTKVMPAMRAFGDFFEKYKTPILVVAGIITTVLVASVIAWGIQSGIAAAAAVAGFVASQAAAIASAAGQVIALGTVIAGYVATGIAALAAGAQMAAAWLIGLGPIAIVVAAVAAAAALIVVHWDTIVNAAKAVWNWISQNWPLLLAIITGPIGLAVLAVVKHWDTIKTKISEVKDFIGGAVAAIAGFFSRLPGQIGGFFSGLASTIKQPFLDAFNAVKRWWNNTVGGFGFTTPNWLPFGAGGKSFKIPEMHTGGIVPGGKRNEPVVRLQGGEGVFTPEQMAALAPVASGGAQGGTIVVNLVVDGQVLAQTTIDNVALLEQNTGRRYFG